MRSITGGRRALGGAGALTGLWALTALCFADQTATVRSAPAEFSEVVGERTRLSPETPQTWTKGTKLRAIQHLGPGQGVPANGALDPDSVVVRHGDVVLERAKDYILDPVWGSLGLGPDARVTDKDWITVDYRYSLRRMDSLVRTADGREAVRKGEPDLFVPEPPSLAPGEIRLANLFVDYHCDGQNPDVFPIEETPDQAPTLTTPGRIPKTMDRIRSGRPVKIVCWGDSVTVGGDASDRDRTRYVVVFERRLKAMFADADLAVETIAVGGSNSRQWLYPEKFGHRDPQRRQECGWERIEEAKPDLVTIEFVNDAGLADKAAFDGVYEDILTRLQKIGAEVILITPHFTRPAMMGFQTLRETDKRPYVLNLRAFAEKHRLALADASSRWAHLWKEGIPYVTLLRNGINHPDDRGHALFAEELIKCFEP